MYKDRAINFQFMISIYDFNAVNDYYLFDMFQ